VSGPSLVKQARHQSAQYRGSPLTEHRETSSILGACANKIVAMETELATLRAENARLARDYTELRGDYDAVGGKLTVERKYSDELRAENARLRKAFDAVIALAENAPCPGEADETESGHRYAQGYRDASCAAAETLRELTAKIIALAPQEPDR
jgi:hypothetical protein